MICYKAVDFAVFTILRDAGQNFRLSIGHLPAWSFGIKISGAFFVDIFGTIH